jgi:hypothetical protein
MRFKVWLESRVDRYSWLDPSGFFHPVTYAGHYGFARKILVEKYNLSLEQMKNNAVVMLMEKGWMRITYFNRDLVAENHFVYPNHKQLSALENLAIELKMYKVEFDNGKELKTIYTL